MMQGDVMRETGRTLLTMVQMTPSEQGGVVREPT